MLGINHSKNSITKDIKYKTIEQGAKYSYWNMQIEI